MLLGPPLGDLGAKGVVGQVAQWLDAQLPQLQYLWTEVTALLTSSWSALQPENLVELPSKIPALVEQALGLAGEVVGYAASVATARRSARSPGRRSSAAYSCQLTPSRSVSAIAAEGPQLPAA